MKVSSKVKNIIGVLIVLAFPVTILIHSLINVGLIVTLNIIGLVLVLMVWVGLAFYLITREEKDDD
jgi:hypothetical protein